MHRDELINMVKIRMDEISPFEDAAMQTSTLIESLLDDAAENIILSFPDKLFPPAVTSVSIVNNGDGSGYFPIPDDLLKLLRLKMTGWERPVTKLQDASDPEYLLQSDTSLRGGASRPKAFLVQRSGSRVIEYYSLNTSTHEVEDFAYLKKVSAENIPGKTVNGLAWECARLAFLSLEEPEAAKACESMVNEQRVLLA